jgi:endonuclease/exonuclease/phosphatase family metal-dependent hydrolase
MPKKTRKSSKAVESLCICSYNIQMTMFHITEQRLKLIVDELHRMKSDVICLQECFEETAIHTICDALRHIYRYMYNETQDKPFYNTNSGLVILSKYPLQNVHFERYTHRTFVDALAHKGFVCCEIVAPSHHLVLCNTHLQADYPLLNCAAVRKKQLEQLCNFVRRSYVNARGNPKQWPVVMCGDWNIPMHSESYQSVFTPVMQTTMPYPYVKYDYTGSNTNTNHNMCITNSCGLLDYFIIWSQGCSAYRQSQQTVHTHPIYTFSDHKWTVLHSRASTAKTARNHTIRT